MLSARAGKILRHIVEQYIEKAVPVPSTSIAANSALGLSSATIRNEMALLEQEGYIFRPHTSAGSIPSDAGYRHYVESLKGVTLSPVEQRLISQAFHQVEREIDEWLGLAATLLSQLVRNVAVVSTPRQVDCKLKRVELVALQDALALMICVLTGARLKEKLIAFDRALPQSSLTGIANKLNSAYSGLSQQQIVAKDAGLDAMEQQMADHLVTMMQMEDERDHEKTMLDGWHFILDQPEFRSNDRMRPLMELVEYHNLLKSVLPVPSRGAGVQVIIGKENREQTIHDYSVVISRYGLPGEATGTILVLGPTRMSYARAISTVDYVSSILSDLMAGLYGREIRRTSTN